jgi:iron complex transport system ATP-binding protein
VTAQEMHRVVLLRNGKVLADGDKRKVMTNQLLSECYGVDVRVRWSGGYCDVHLRD